MWLSKKDSIISLLVAYGFLIMLFFMLERESVINTPCNWEQSCVRVCCDNTTLCKDDFIRKNFEANFSYFDDEKEDPEEKNRFLVLHGAPKCNLKDVTPGPRKMYYVSCVLDSNVNLFSSTLLFKERKCADRERRN
jgi:hypothetical protein